MRKSLVARILIALFALTLMSGMAGDGGRLA